MSDEPYELSPTEWVRKQTERVLSIGTTDGVEIMGRPIVLFTVRGARTGTLRKVPLMRVEHDGRWAMVASKGGAPSHPAWYANVRAHPEVAVQDGAAEVACRAREVDGVERDEWWARAVDAFPPYAEYQQKTERRIPVLVCEPIV